MKTIVNLIILLFWMSKSIEALDEKAYNEWYDNQLKGEHHANKKWYCAVSQNNGVMKKTTKLKEAEGLFTTGSSSRRQAIIPMTGGKAGDPHTLSKSWGTGSMWWNDWSDINQMRAQCENSGMPNFDDGTLLSALEVDCDWTLPDAGIIKKSYTVICPSHCLDVNHCMRVKGSGPYSVNSPVCLAAIHAGVFAPEKGGAIEVNVVEGRPNYSASLNNGVGTIPYGAYFASFNVKKSDISCGPTVPPTAAPCVDSAILDIAFVADSSRSVGKTDFKNEMKFIADITNLFRVGPKQSRVGLVTFATYPQTQFNFEKYSTKDAVVKAINAVPHKTGGTYVGKALWRAVADMKFRPQQEVEKIVVVFTDGQSFDHVKNPVKALTKKGVRMIAFGVGDIKVDTMLKIANGIQDNVYSVASYSDLKNFMGSLVTKICGMVLAPR